MIAAASTTEGAKEEERTKEGPTAEELIVEEPKEAVWREVVPIEEVSRIRVLKEPF